MAKAKVQSVDEYLASLPEDMRRVLERVRGIIRKAVPGVEEAISYGIPTFKRDGRVVVHLAGWKAYYSLYPANARVVAQFENELTPYLAEKSTLRFPLAKPVPAKLIERIAKFRAKEVSDRAPR